MSRNFAATDADHNPSVIVISDSSSMANNHPASKHSAQSKSIELESTRVDIEEVEILTHESERRGTSPILDVGEKSSEPREEIPPAASVEPIHDSEKTMTESSSSEPILKKARRSKNTRCEVNSAFGLTKNLATEADLSTLRLKFNIDRSKYRLFLKKEVTSMSTKAVPIPLAHFDAGLRLPLNLSLVNFLIFVRAQPAHLHLNTVRLVMCLIVLCRRFTVEMSENLLRHYFSSLRMTNNVLSMRPRNHVASLFCGLPNKIRWTNRWVMVEAKHGFPFPPLVGHICKWDALGSEPKWSESDLRFLAAIKESLGVDPRS